MLTNERYKISFVLDRSAMFKIDSARGRHSVKPLSLIWSKLTQYSASNTLHIDDLSRNFAMNPGNGIKVHAFWRDREGAAEDEELVLLGACVRLRRPCPRPMPSSFASFASFAARFLRFLRGAARRGAARRGAA